MRTDDHLPFDRLPQVVSALEETLDGLEQGGVRAAIEFRAEAVSRQLAWPDDAPLAEPELRAEVLYLLQEARKLRQRAAALYDALPEPSEEELEQQVPNSLYYSLHDALSSFCECGLDDVIERTEASLAETPESLRSTWVVAKLRKSLGGINGEAAQRLARRLHRTPGEATEPPG